MASRIKYIPIDEEFPKAGEDNSSQGFRDNFDTIKQGLRTAQEEMTDLQINAARKDTNNDFANNTIERANLKNFTKHSVDEGTIPRDTEKTDENVPVDFREGIYRSYVVANHVSITFTDWPTEQYASIIVELTPDYPPVEDETTPGPPYTVTFRSDGDKKIIKDSNNIWQRPYEIDSVRARIGSLAVGIGPDSSPDLRAQVFKFWTHDGGETVYANYIGAFDTSSDPETGGGGTIIESLNDINDVYADTVKDGDIIVYRNPVPGQGQPGWAVETVPEGGGGGGAEEITISSATNDFTLALSDINHYIRITSFGTVEVTVPAATSDIPIGSSVSFFQAGEGAVKMVPATGVTVFSSSGFLTTRDQYSAMTITKIGENTWDLIGDIAAFEFVCGVSWFALGDDQYAPKEILLGDTSPVNTTLPLLGDPGNRLLYLQDPYGNAVDGGFSFVTNTTTNQTEAVFGTAYPKHDLLFYVYDSANPVNYYTLGSEFAADEAVIYFRPEFDSTTVAEATYTLKLIYRDPEQYAAFAPGSAAATQTFTITAEEYNNHRSGIFAIPFPEPGAFNGITIECDNTLGLAGAIVDFRLCLNQAQMTWPFAAPVLLGDMADDPIIITDFTTYTEDTTVLPGSV